MCPVDTIPYFREIAFAVIILLFIASFFIKEKCRCSKEIAALEARVAALESKEPQASAS